MRTLILAIGVIGALGLLPGGPRHSSARGANPDPQVLADAEFDPAGQILSVPVTIGSNRYRFGLMTRRESIFGWQFGDKLARRPPELDIPDRPDELGEINFRSAPEAVIGSMKVRYPCVSVKCGRYGWYGTHFALTDGVIGLDVLVRHIVQIDFDNGKIRFLRSLPEDPGARLEIISLQKRPRQCAVMVMAQCDDQPAEQFYVNLENPSEIALRAPVYRRLFESGRLRRVHEESSMGSRMWPKFCAGIASSFRVGPFESANVRVVVDGDNEIGLEHLSRYTVTFDFPRGFMYLRPGKQFERHSAIDISGLFPQWGQDGLEVDECKPGSPAAIAGLRSGDLILAVDGHPVARDDQATFWRALRREGATLRIRFQRGERQKETNMKLEAAPDQFYDTNDEDDVPIPDFPSRGEPFELTEPDAENLRDGNARSGRDGGAETKTSIFPTGTVRSALMFSCSMWCRSTSIRARSGFCEKFRKMRESSSRLYRCGSGPGFAPSRSGRNVAASRPQNSRLSLNVRTQFTCARQPSTDY